MLIFFSLFKIGCLHYSIIFDIISARAEEIIEFLRKNIVSSGINLGDIKKIYFYGNTYNIDDIHELLTSSFDLLAENIVSYMDATFAGSLKILLEGHNTEAIPKYDRQRVKKFWFF